MTHVDRVRVLIVDDHPALSYGAKLYLENSGRVEVAEIAATGSDAIDAVKRLQPNVVVLDLHLPDMTGIDVTQRIRNTSDAHIVIYTGDDDWVQYFDQLIALRISGIVHKKYSLEYLEYAVEGALNGYAALPLDVFHIMRIPASSGHQLGEYLTGREMDILRLLDKGYTNQEIADELYVSSKTIENNLTHIYKKLEVGSRYEAIGKFKKLHKHV